MSEECNIILSGGPRSGERYYAPNLWPEINIPIPQPAVFSDLSEPTLLTANKTPIIVYRRTSARDGELIVYRFCGIK